MDKKPPPTTLLELTVEALDSREKRWDWDWIVCYHIREWERRNAEQYADKGYRLLHGHFAWYHWHEICDRVLTRARQVLQAGKDKWLAYGNHEDQWEFSRKVCYDMVYPECEVAFAAFARALQKHGLPLYEQPRQRIKRRRGR